MRTRQIDVQKNKSIFKKALSVLLAIVLITSLNCYSYSWGDFTDDSSSSEGAAISIQSNEDGTPVTLKSSIDEDATHDELEKKVATANSTDNVAGEKVDTSVPVSEAEGIGDPSTSGDEPAMSTMEGEEENGDEATEEEAETPSDDAVEATAFTDLRDKIQAADGPSEIVLTENVVATETITVNRAVKIFGSENISISRDNQTHSIFTVASEGNLTLVGVKLVGQNESRTGNKTNTFVSPILVDGGSFAMMQKSLIDGFAAKNGGAISVSNNGKVVLNASTISNNAACAYNTAAFGGGIYSNTGTVVVRSGSAILNNVADSYTSSSSNFPGGSGGGVYLTNAADLTLESSAISNNRAGRSADPADFTFCRYGSGGGISVNRHCSFTMNEGVIENNSAFAKSGTYGGGGIYINSLYDSNWEIYEDKVTLNSGVIRGNVSDFLGGGVYVHVNSALVVHNALLSNNDTSNKYGTYGGGLYFCDQGSGAFFSTSGSLFTNNRATEHGDDCGFSEENYYAAPFAHVATRQHDGTQIDWYEDSKGSRYQEGVTVPLQNVDEYVAQTRESEDVALHSTVDSIAAGYRLQIVDNKADRGGGIACNGYLYMGEQKDIQLTINKQWKDAVGNDLAENEIPESVTVEVYKGSKQIDSVTLSRENGWSATLIDLPYGDDYTIKEIDTEGFGVTYDFGDGSGSFVPDTPNEAYTVTITNTALPQNGSLTITKNMAGNFQAVDNGNSAVPNLVGDVTAVFQVTGTAINENGDTVEIYNQYVGMNFAANGSMTQTTVLSDLPLGTYTIREVAYDGSGYATVGDAIQVVPLGGAEGSDIEVTFNNETIGDNPSTGIVNRYSKNQSDSEQSFDYIRFLKGAIEQTRTEEVA